MEKDPDYKEAYHSLVNSVSDVIHHRLTHVVDNNRFYDPAAQELLAGVEKSRKMIK